MCAAFLTVKVSGADEAKASKLDEELNAARMTEEAVMAGLASKGKGDPAPEDLEKIARIYKQIIEENPKSAQAWNADAEYLWRIDRHSDAMAEWKTAETLEPGNAVVANHLGVCHLELGNAKSATVYFERAAKLDPKNALYQFNAGNTSFLFRHEMTGSIDSEQAVILRSLVHFRIASQVDPFNIEYAQAYAQTFYAIQPPDWNAALAAWNHYLEITDQKDYAYSNLARVNLKLGRKQDARDNLAKIEGAKFEDLKKHLLLETDKKPE